MVPTAAGFDRLTVKVIVPAASLTVTSSIENCGAPSLSTIVDMALAGAGVDPLTGLVLSYEERIGTKGELVASVEFESIDLEIERDDHFLLDPEHGYVRVALDFWTAIQKKKEPPKDPTRDIYLPTGEALETWTAKAGEYRDLAAEKKRLEALVKELKEQMDAIEGQLVTMMGGFLSANTAGLEVTRYDQRGAIDYQAALASLHPDTQPDLLEGFRRASSERVKVTVLKEDKATVPFDSKVVEAAWKDAKAAQGFYF